MRKRGMLRWLAVAMAATLTFSSLSAENVVFADETIVTSEIGSAENKETTEVSVDGVIVVDDSDGNDVFDYVSDDKTGDVENTYSTDTDDLNEQEVESNNDLINESESSDIENDAEGGDEQSVVEDSREGSAEENKEFTDLVVNELELDQKEEEVSLKLFGSSVMAIDDDTDNAETTYVAKIDDTQYETLQDALDAIASGEVSGNTVVLLTDLELYDDEKQTVFFEIKSDVTIDLNSHTIKVDEKNKGSLVFKLSTAEKTVTIKNGTIDGNETAKGAVIANYRYRTSFSTGNILNLENLTIQKFAGGGDTTYFAGSLVYLNNAFSLSLDNCTITENGCSAFCFQSGTEGSTVTVESSTISDNGYPGKSGAGFYINKASTVTISSNTISNNHSNNASNYLNGGGFSVTSSNNVIISDNKISNNAAKLTEYTNGYGGGFYIEKTTGSLTISNNIISKNSGSSYGGGMCIRYMTGSLTISGNKITDNKSDSYGGGCYIKYMSGDLEISDNTISQNMSEGYGGGIYVYNANTTNTKYEFGKVEITGNIIDSNTVGLGSKTESNGDNAENETVTYYSKGGGIAFYDRVNSHTNTSAYDLSGNTITNNEVDSTYGRGGGLSLMGRDENREFLISSGTITGNSAAWGGGIDYTYHCAAILHLYNAIVTRNTAANGGGLWSCPSSTTTMYVTLGGTIYGNTGDDMADSIRFEGDSSEYSGSGGVFATVAARALGGTLMDWYSDEEDARYADGNATVDIADYTNRETSFSLHGELSEEGIALAEAASTLLIADNTATQVGGGIASNAGVKFGTDGEVSVTVTKEWETSSGNTPDKSLLPESVAIQLVRVDNEGNEVNLESVELTADDDWSYTFSELPTNYTYKVVETSSGDYTVSYSDAVENEDGNYAITLTNVIETVDISGTKTWNDGDDQDGKRPETITVNLRADGEIINSVDVTKAEDGTWTYSFTDLPKYADGVEIEYAVLEEAVENYSPTYDGYDITNSYTPEQTSVSVTKVWNDGSNADGVRPSSVTITLLKNGETTEQTLTLSENNNWTGSFTDLDKYTGGTENVYTIAETSVSGYTAAITGSASEGFVVTNTHTVTTTENPTNTTKPTNTTDTTETATENTSDPVSVEKTVTAVETSNAETKDGSNLETFIAIMVICVMALIALVAVQTRKRIK